MVLSSIHRLFSFLSTLWIDKQQKAISPLRKASLRTSSDSTPQHLCRRTGQSRENCEHHQLNFKQYIYIYIYISLTIKKFVQYGTNFSSLLKISLANFSSLLKIFCKIQKEKLHAELKRVLSEKRSHLRETNSTITDMEENMSKMDSKSEVIWIFFWNALFILML